MTIKLRGITWDHPRGYQPLAANTRRFTAEHPGIEVEWTRRSLRDFGVQPIEDLAQRYDLLVIDHPWSGRAKSLGSLLDLRPLFPREFHAMLADQTVGPSTRSYDYGGIWGLPTDAAAQVASYRSDLLAALGFDGPPKTAAEVLALGKAARKAGKWLAMPSCQSDATCLVVTLSANLGKPMLEKADRMLDADTFNTVLDYLAELEPLTIPASREWNPIATYNAMSTGDDIVYVPFAFSYTNYSRLGARKPIRFTTIAGPGPDPKAGAILGGAGCAISAKCAEVDAAVTYLSWVHRPEHQAGDYFSEGGQPGLRAAWTDPECDRQAGGFFSGTLETMDKAFLRPRFDGFIPASEHMGMLVHRWLKGDGDRATLISESNDIYARASEQAARSAH
ncbi:ABC transporter substrate-binding protein [Mesorhizobium sp. CN2-181]|uniref:ABC transporter substrate-binding protein n=1 Tax=Mesorhizobium yinganensis TaxID=3157707 RepID=UPI0032B83675